MSDDTPPLARMDPTEADSKAYTGVPMRPRSDAEALMELVQRFQEAEVEKTRMNNETQQLAIRTNHELELKRLELDRPTTNARVITTYVVLAIGAVGSVVGFSIAAANGQIERAFALLTPVLLFFAGRNAKLPGLDDKAKASR